MIGGRERREREKNWKYLSRNKKGINREMSSNKQMKRNDFWDDDVGQGKIIDVAGTNSGYGF